MPSNIPAGRVPMIDFRSGLVNRDWYAFFRELFILVDAAHNAVTLSEIQQLPPPVPPSTDSGIPTGMIAFFMVTTAPDGWEEVTALRGRFPRGMMSGGTPGATGGADTHNHGINTTGANMYVNLDYTAGGSALTLPHANHAHAINFDYNIPPYVDGMWCRKL